MKLALVVLSFFLLCACGSVTKEHIRNEMIIAVTAEGETKEWRLNFGSERTQSCYLSGDVRKGTSTNIASQNTMSIAYVRAGDVLIIETPSGLCDAGAETKLTLVDGLYEGELFERSFFGYEKIGFVKEVRQ